MPIVLDTHAWLWWAAEDPRLSAAARRAINRSLETEEVLLSLISVWELAKKVEKRQLVLDRPVGQWIDKAVMREGLQLVELTRPVLIASCQLPAPFHGDPADQIIVATARDREATLVTKDAQIRGYAHVKSVW